MIVHERVPALFHSGRHLNGLAVNHERTVDMMMEGLGSSCCLHFDGFRLRLFILRQIDLQQAVFELRADFAAAGAFGQREAPEEFAVRLFADSCLLLFIEHAEGLLADGCDQTGAGPELALLPASAHT